MPSAGPETTEGVRAVVVSVLGFGGFAAGAFARSFLKSFFNSEPRTEEKRVVFESADIADMGGMRGVGARLGRDPPSHPRHEPGRRRGVGDLCKQEHRADVWAEMIADERQRDEDRRREERDGRR